MAQAPVLPTSELAADDIVVLRGASWADYQRLLEVRADAAVPRLTYLEGVLELTSPSKSHESVTSMLGRLVEPWCTENEIDITPYGSWSHEFRKSERGADPDECYVVGDDAAPARCDLAMLPALDLVTLVRFVDVIPMTRAVREYRAALRAARAR